MSFQILGNKIPKEIEAMRERFRQRDMFVDCRGTLQIGDNVMFGFNIRIYTLSHDINDFRKTVDRPVFIERDVFVGSDCILYNCTIREHSIISVGSIVKNIEIPANVIVAGNPLRVISERKDGEWVHKRNTKVYFDQFHDDFQYAEAYKPKKETGEL